MSVYIADKPSTEASSLADPLTKALRMLFDSNQTSAKEIQQLQKKLGRLQREVVKLSGQLNLHQEEHAT